MDDTGLYQVNPRNPWKKWFAWRPVYVHGRRVWLEYVYRKATRKTYTNSDDWTSYVYGTVFDVLKDGNGS